MKGYERKQLLERVDRAASTVGATIPDTIEVQGEPLDLQSFVFEIKRLDRVPPGREPEVEAAKKNLRRERVALRNRIEEDDISREEGEDLVRRIVGIDRALNALDTLGPTDLEAEGDALARADQERWLRFLRKVTSIGDDRRGPR